MKLDPRTWTATAMDLWAEVVIRLSVIQQVASRTFPAAVRSHPDEMSECMVWMRDGFSKAGYAPRALHHQQSGNN